MKLNYASAIVASLSLTVGNALAGVTLTGGTGTLVSNPNNQRYYADAYNLDTVLYWTEQTSQPLTADLVVSMLPPASFPFDSTSHSEDNSLTIPQGTTIDSYFLCYDPSGNSTVASFKFDDPIVGLITNSRDTAANDHFMLSDFLINPLVPAPNLSPTHYDARGIEPANGDYIRWISATEIELHIGASIPGDHIRVITSPVPEPASALMFGLGCAMMALHRQRRV